MSAYRLGRSTLGLIFSALAMTLLAGCGGETIVSTNYPEPTYLDLPGQYNFRTIESNSPIVPIIIGSDNDALSLSEHLKKDEIIAIAIRPPTVPENSSRIRFTISAEHSEKDIKALITSLKQWQQNAL